MLESCHTFAMSELGMIGRHEGIGTDGYAMELVQRACLAPGDGNDQLNSIESTQALP